jgi:hypothetical protein
LVCGGQLNSKEVPNMSGKLESSIEETAAEEDLLELRLWLITNNVELFKMVLNRVNGTL